MPATCRAGVHKPELVLDLAGDEARIVCRAVSPGSGLGYSEEPLSHWAQAGPWDL